MEHIMQTVADRIHQRIQNIKKVQANAERKLQDSMLYTNVTAESTMKFIDEVSKSEKAIDYMVEYFEKNIGSYKDYCKENDIEPEKTQEDRLIDAIYVLIKNKKV